VRTRRIVACSSRRKTSWFAGTPAPGKLSQLRIASICLRKRLKRLGIFPFQDADDETQVRFGSQSRSCADAIDHEPNEQARKSDVMRTRFRRFCRIAERMSVPVPD